MTLSGQRIVKGTVFAGLGSIVAVGALLLGFEVFDRYNPPLLPDRQAVSAEVVDVDGKLLRAFATPAGRWRLRTRLDDVDPEYLDLLIAYEDQRFWTHSGVDPLALIRAAGQWIGNGRIVSGGSTITMQLARLLEPRQSRSIPSKVQQIVRALQIERRLTKAEILESYLTLAPYGGNLEGVRAASLAWFAREPRDLSLAQAALLVALPQSPERRRPDRHPARAQAARDTVLARVAGTGVIAPGEVARAASTKVANKRYALPQFAALLAQRAVQVEPDQSRHQVTLKRDVQRALEQVARGAAHRFDPQVSIALVLADGRTGAILAEVGSPNYLDPDSAGWIDMTRAVRSPGSALKPFIYGLAFEEGLVRPATLILDTPSNFAGYRPQNFDMKYQGEVSVARALQMSLNVPAVHLLEAVGPARLMSRIKRAGVNAVIPASERPGLAIGLGGVGISLRDLTQLYTGLVNGGQTRALHDGLPVDSLAGPPGLLLQADAVWHVNDVLRGVSPPPGVKPLGIAYKTGTSYGYRDAFAVGYDGRHVLGVWVGRADNGSVPGITGRTAAAPILFEAFARSGLTRQPFAPASPGALRTAQADLPITLQRFQAGPNLLAAHPEPAPQIVYPPAGARVELGRTATGQSLPLVLKLQDGRPPFRWLANGKPIDASARRRIANWIPGGGGFSTLTVIDADGRADSVELFVDAGD